MQTGGFQNQSLMRLTLFLTLIFLAGFWVTNFALYFAKMDLTPQSVQDYYLGSQEQFKMPRTYQSMLEVSHAHLPMMAIVVLLLTHLLIFAPYSFKTKVVFISSGFVLGLINESAGWLVRFVHPGFAPLKVAGFMGFQGVLGFLITALALFLFKSKRPTDNSKLKNSSKENSVNNKTPAPAAQSVPLDVLEPGDTGTIAEIATHIPELMEMGLIPGTQVRLVKFAPLGDPMELNVRGYNLSVRRSEAKHILIEKEISQN